MNAIAKLTPPESTESKLCSAIVVHDLCVKAVRNTKVLVDQQLRALADERRVAFIRLESARREFGL